MPENLFVEIVVPDKRIFQGDAEGVRAPGVEGAFEVLRNHAPMIAAFEVGPLNVRTSSGERITYATSGGFLEVINNHVTVLAETAEPVSEIDVEQARQAEKRAQERLQNIDREDREQAEAALERARNRLRLAIAHH